MEQHLRITINAPVELVVGLGSLVNTNFVRHHEGWLRLPGDNKVPQITIVRLKPQSATIIPTQYQREH
jgi:hypothetical protein